MSRTQKFFLLLLLTGPIHMAEQLTTNIEEFFMIRRTVIEPYFSMFAARPITFSKPPQAARTIRA